MLGSNTRFNDQGFTLIEMAVVLLILGTLLGGLLSAIAQVSDNARRTNAGSDLERIEEALFGFAQAHGYLPCPASAISSGVQDPVGGGNCSFPHGFVPAATLGLAGRINTDGLLMDPWSNPYRYSVATRAQGVNRSFTSRPGLADEFDAQNLDETDMLKVCEALNGTADDCSSAAEEISGIVPAIIISMGEDWVTFTSDGENANGAGDTLLGAGAAPVSYSVTNTSIFVDTEYSEDLFDDQLLWLSPYTLYSRLISAGRLPQ